MFFRVYDVTYAEIQFNRSRLCNFTSSWKMVKNTIKLYYRRSFLHKSNEKCKENQGVICFIHSRVWRHIRWMQNFVTLKLCEVWWNRHKTLYNGLNLFNCQIFDIKTGVKLWPQFPFKCLLMVYFQVYCSCVSIQPLVEHPFCHEIMFSPSNITQNIFSWNSTCKK